MTIVKSRKKKSPPGFVQNVSPSLPMKRAVAIQKRIWRRLSAVSAKIDNLQAALPRPIDPQLAHYFQRRSYDKALEFLEQRQPL